MASAAQVRPGSAAVRGRSRTGRDGQQTGLHRAAAGRRRVSSAVSGKEDARQAQIAEMQRARLLAAAARVVDDHGYANATVAHITGRARVSRRTFYELFENCEACLVAVLEDTVACVQGELAGARLERLEWRERMRAGLAAILGFLDSEPALARFCVVQSLRGGPAMLARREQLLATLARAVDEGREAGTERAAAAAPPLTGEGVIGAAVGILYSRLLRGEREPLAALQSQLMALIVLPYLGAAAARREQERPAPAARRLPAQQAAAEDPLAGVPMRLTYRTARVLECVAEQPGANNRAVAERAGIHDQGQVSKLLGRLQRLGLLVNEGLGHVRGEPNAWRLTDTGLRVMGSIAPLVRGNGSRRAA